MLRMRIKAYQVGLVFKNGELRSLLQKGVYWIPFGAEVKVFNTTQAFYAPVDWAILEKNEELVAMLEMVEVGDNEIVLEYKNNRFSQVLSKGRYAYWKGVLNLRFEHYNMSELEVPSTLALNTIRQPEVLRFVRIYEVLPHEKAVLYVDGKRERMLNGGIYYMWNNGTSVKFDSVDLRQQPLEVNGQELLTADKASIRINLDATYKVVDVEKALIVNKNFNQQLYTSLQLALREYVGQLTLDDLLTAKERVAESVSKEVAFVADDLGVKLLSVGIRDIILPGDVKEIMNRVLVAQKEAQANVITRREETASTRSLLNTAKLMEENEMLFRLKEMEYVEKIAGKIGEISLSGNDGMVKQLKEIFGTKA